MYIRGQMWITSKKQDVKSACYFWPGSDVNITGGYPDYWELFDSKVGAEKRMYGGLDWLDLPKEERFVHVVSQFPRRA